MICGVIHDPECMVFLIELGKGSSNLIFLTLLDSSVSLACIRNRKFCRSKENRVSLGRKGIACVDIAELSQSTDITGMEFRNFLTLVASHDIELADAEFGLLLDIIHSVVRLKNAGHDLDEAVLTDERVSNALPDICCLFLAVIVVCLEIAVCLLSLAGSCKLGRIREERNDIIHEVGDTLKVCCGTKEYRNDGSIGDTYSNRFIDFVCCELVTAEISLHELF